MQQSEVDEILKLYNEAGVEAASRSLPKYLIFAEKIISRELELVCKVLCFQCAEGHMVRKKGGNSNDWVHIIAGTIPGYELIEPCRANSVRARRG